MLTFKKDGGCDVPQLSHDMRFKGGATNGEEITITLDTAVNTYRVSIDASDSAARQGLTRSGSLVFNAEDCIYTMSGEKFAQVAVNPEGVLLGGIDNGDPDAPPASIIAFKDTSTRLRDLAGDWWVLRKDRDNGAASLSRLLPAYDTTIQSDGKFSNCSSGFAANDASCIRSAGRFVPYGTVFRTTSNSGSDMSLVLGNVAGNFVPVLLTRDHLNRGLHVLVPRAPQSVMPTPSS
jgi:hypothetical protein